MDGISWWVNKIYIVTKLKNYKVKLNGMIETDILVRHLTHIKLKLFCNLNVIKFEERLRWNV
ncbi:hypothetical protein ABIA69_002433 [Lysinibacillus parviboronicapiens]|uniref:Uncharacterized protein n=1 Tax=Lysinibacillus parviboronicapiens TaxID=436516 RepID=A0ABV2PKU9_9BACI